MQQSNIHPHAQLHQSIKNSSTSDIVNQNRMLTTSPKSHATTMSEIMIRFMRENPGPAIIYFASLILVPLYDVALPHYYGRVVQAIQSNADLIAPFLKVIAIIIIINVGVFVAEWNETNNTYPALQSSIRKIVMEKLFKRYENDFDEQKTASLIAKIMKLPNVLYNMVEQYKMVLFPQALVTLSIIVYFAMQDVLLGVVLMAFVICIFAFVSIAPYSCGQVSENRELSLYTINEELDDILRNMMAIYNTNNYSKEDGILDNLHEEYKTHSKGTQFCIMRQRGAMLPLQIGLFGFFMWRCYNLLKIKKLNTGSFVSMFLIMMSLNGSVAKLTVQVKELVMRHGVLSASQDIMQTPIESIIHSWSNSMYGKKDEIPNNVVIHFENISYKYPGAINPILSNVSLNVLKGQRMLIVGRIGSGKSTLLKLLMKYKTPSDGEIYFEKRPYTSLSTKTIRQIIGYVPQTPILFNRTIFDNITYGINGNVSKSDVEELLNTLGLGHIFANMSMGLDANVGKNGSKLSGGQRQIVWIIRVLLQNPEVLLMDEPTASIDEHTKDIVRNLLSKIMEGRTVIMVTHDDYLEKFANRIIKIDEGRVVSDELLNQY